MKSLYYVLTYFKNLTDNFFLIFKATRNFLLPYQELITVFVIFVCFAIIIN